MDASKRTAKAKRDRPRNTFAHIGLDKENPTVKTTAMFNTEQVKIPETAPNAEAERSRFTDTED